MKVTESKSGDKSWEPENYQLICKKCGGQAYIILVGYYDYDESGYDIGPYIYTSPGVYCGNSRCTNPLEE